MHGLAALSSLPFGLFLPFGFQGYLCETFVRLKALEAFLSGKESWALLLAQAG